MIFFNRFKLNECKHMVKTKCVRVPPAGGKTHLAAERPDLFVDSDQLVQLLGYHPSKEGVEQLRGVGGPDWSLIDALIKGRLLLTNFDPNWLSGRSDIFVVTVGYHPIEYLEHISISKRDDLFDHFSHDELEGWMSDTFNYRMPKGKYIGDFLNEGSLTSFLSKLGEENQL